VSKERYYPVAAISSAGRLWMLDRSSAYFRGFTFLDVGWTKQDYDRLTIFLLQECPP
jgi:hypothetical protein